MAELSSRMPLTSHLWAPPSEAPPVANPKATVVVDSLHLQSPSALRTLRRRHADAPLVLMAHYLHCIDPYERATEQADTERALLPLFDGVVTTSQYAKRAITDQGVPARTVAAVPPGLDAAYRAPLPDPPSAPPTLLTVANVVPGKGLSSLAQHLPRLADLDWRWHLVGDDTLAPDTAARLRDILRATSIADRVTGPTCIDPADMPAQYDRAALFVLPSRFETCSMATREALARGCPVVGYDVGGLSENLGDAAPSRLSEAADAAPAGRLVPPDSPTALTDVLRTLLTSPDTRAAMRTAAHERSRAFPTWPAAATQFESALQSFSPPSS